MHEQLLSRIKIEDGDAENPIELLLDVDNGSSEAFPQHLLLRVQGRIRRVRADGGEK